ncbi:hypothetical protein KAS50_07290, partial [bacterium]|nr:hypothetical protein [bacterium]
MRFINKSFLGASVRTWLCIVILIGSFLTVHGIVMNTKVGGHVFEYVFGIVLAVVSMLLAAVPTDK